MEIKNHFKENISLVNYLAEEKIYELEDFKLEHLFKFYLVNDLNDLFFILDKYILLTMDMEKELTFYDYYILIYLLEKETRSLYTDLLIKDDKLIKIINEYSNLIDLDELLEIVRIRHFIMKVYDVGSEQDFINNLYILKDYYEINKEVKVLEPNICVIKETKEYSVKKIDPIVKQQRSVQAKKVSKKEVEDLKLKNDIYELFIKGTLTFKKEQKEIFNNLSYFNTILKSINNDMKKIEKEYKIIILYKRYYNINKDLIYKFNHDLIEEKHFLREVIKRKDDFNKAVKDLKQYNISMIYDVFSNIVLVFDYKKDNFEINDFKNYFLYLGVNYKLYEDNNFISENWKVFIDINKEIINIDNIVEEEKILKENKNKFINKIRHGYLLSNIKNKINNIDETNDQLFFNNIIDNKDIKDSFIIRGYEKIEHLKEISYKDLYEILNTNNKVYYFDQILNIFYQDIEKVIKSEFNIFIKERLSPRELEILSKRATNVTLQDIGEELDITRERVRQIESQAKEKLLSNKNYKKAMLYLKLFTDSGLYISEQKVMTICQEHYYLFKDLNKELFNNNTKYYEFVDLNKFKEKVLNIIDDIKDNVIHINELEYLIHQLVEDYNKEYNVYIGYYYTKMTFLQHLILIGDYAFTKTPTLVDKYYVILKNHFHDYPGISSNYIDEFKESYFEVFNDDSIFEKEGRSIISRVVEHRNVIQIDRGLYTVKKLDIDDELLNDIYEFIKKEKAYMTQGLFEKYKYKLKDNIKNHYELHGILKSKYSDLYFTKDTVGTYKNPKVDIDQIIYDYAVRNNGVISLMKLEKELPELKGIQLEFQIGQNSNYIGMFYQNYIHKDYLYKDDLELSKLKEKVSSKLEIETILRSRDIYDLMNRFTPNIVINNNIENIHYAYNYFKYYFENDFSFKNPYVAKKGEKIIRNRYNTIISYVLHYKIIRIEDIRIKALEEKIRIDSMKDLLEDIYEYGYVRLDDNLIGKKDALNEVMLSRHKLINESIKNNLRKNQKLKELDLSFLPEIKVKWNYHLLSSYINLNMQDIKLTVLGNQYHNLDYIVEKI